MKKYIILIISFFLDLSLLNFLPYSYQNISYLYPCFFISTVFLTYNLFLDNKTYFKTILILSIIYGSIFLNSPLLGIFIFLLLGYASKNYHKYITINYFSMLIGIILIIILNDSIIYLILSFSEITTFSIKLLIYKLTRSIPINIIYTTLVYNYLIKISSTF